MDGNRFDALTRSLGAAATRRRLLRWAAGGALAGAVARVGQRAASAQCGPGQVDCGGGVCSGLMFDPLNCGSCGHVCPGGQACCLGACVDLMTDGFNCGGCAVQCAANYACVNGYCLFFACGAPLIPCNNDCVDPLTDSANCGSCGHACPQGQLCQTGVCVSTCPPGEIDCGAGCVDTSSDPNNCGTCGHACQAGEVCLGNLCLTACEPPLIRCGDACVDLLSDNINCGQCAHPCANQHGNGICCEGVCYDETADSANCGACHHVCKASDYCVASSCVPIPTTCAPGLTSCNGICVDLTSDPFNCSSCGAACAGEAPPGQASVGQCVNGTCVAVCLSGYTKCGAHCVDLASDPANCGACGAACAGQCVAGVCQTALTPTPPTPPTPPAPDKWALWTGATTALRGASIYQRRLTADDPPEMGGAFGPVYEQADFDRLARLGANYVDLSVPATLGERAPYDADDAAAKNLDRLIGLAAKAGLFVVITFRTGPGRTERDIQILPPCLAGGCLAGALPVATPEASSTARLWSTAAAQKAWIALWSATAKAYKHHPNVIGYHLLAAPEIADAGAWRSFASSLAHAIRDADGATPILVSAPKLAAPDQLTDFAPIKHSKLVYRVEPFLPPRYLQQASDAASPLAYGGDFDQALDGSAGPFDRAWLEQQLAPAIDWAAANKLPLMVGAFGAPRWQPGLAAYLRDQMETFDGAGLNHGLWFWEAASAPAEDDAFNLEHGADPARHTAVSSQLVETLRRQWDKNTARPSAATVALV